MKCLIVEDDFAARRLLQRYLSSHRDCDIAVDGNEAIEAFRQIESEHGINGLDGVKVIMTSALGDPKNVMGAFREGCEAYIVKPAEKDKLLEEMEKLGLVEPEVSK